MEALARPERYSGPNLDPATVNFRPRAFASGAYALLAMDPGLSPEAPSNQSAYGPIIYLSRTGTPTTCIGTAKTSRNRGICMRKAVYAIGVAVAGLLARKFVFSGDAYRLPDGGQQVRHLPETISRLRLRNGASTVIVPTAMAIGAISIFRRLSHGNTLRYTFVPTMAVSWLLYMAILRRKRLAGERIVPLYFVSLAWQLVHFLEEYFTGFNYRWPTEIFRTRPYEDKQFVAINVGSYAVFIIGGIALLKRVPEFYLPAVFFSVMGVMFNGVQHPVYSLMVKGYFPGLWTSFLDLVLGPVLLKQLLLTSAPSDTTATA